MLTRIPLPLFTVFNMGDPPTITVPKVLTNMTFPNGGKGGGPTWENSHIFPFFIGERPLCTSAALRLAKFLMRTCIRVIRSITAVNFLSKVMHHNCHIWLKPCLA